METGCRGRPQKVIESKSVSTSKFDFTSSPDIDAALMKIDSIEKVIAELQSEVKELKDTLLNNQRISV